MPPKIVPRPNLAELQALAFGDEPMSSPPRPQVPTIEQLERRRFQLAKRQMDAAIAAFHTQRPAVPDPPVRESLTGAISRGCAGLLYGRRCHHAVHVVASTVPLCPGHLEAMIGVLTGALEGITQPETAPERPVEPPIAPVALSSGAVVYYMGDPPAQVVKIGTTTKLRSRWISLRALKPELLLLAIEPGSYDLERHRHRQFRHLRVAGTREWFRKVPQLMDHVSEVRAKHGIFREGVPSWGVAKPKPLIVPEPAAVTAKGGHLE